MAGSVGFVINGRLLSRAVSMSCLLFFLICCFCSAAVLAAPQAEQAAPLRIGQLDIDLVYDRNRRQFESNIDDAIEYLRRSNVNTVFLEAYSDDKGTGNIPSVYFHTRHAPVKADVFNHVVERLHRANFRVYAWLSTLSGQWLLDGYPEDAVLAWSKDGKGWYRRATPFSSRVREALRNLVGDLAVNSAIDGVLFNDDLYFNDFEDFSPAAKAVFRGRFGRELTPDYLKDPVIMREWTAIKTKVLNDLSLAMIAEIRKVRPNVISARNIFSMVILEEKSEEWFAQNYREYLELYDFTVVMAYPRMEEVKDAENWLKGLAQTALAQPGAANKVIFKLQSYDWATDRWLKKKELERHASALKSGGAIHIAYYPLNVLEERAEPLPF